MSHLNCPPGDRSIDTLSGGEKRRVALCRAIVSRPDFLILDEPTNHLDPESIEWVAEFLENFGGTFLVVTHDRYFLDRVVTRIVELCDGRFFWHDGNYTDYLLDHRNWLAGATMSLADLAAAAQISVADYLGGIDWKGHDQTARWYRGFKSRPSFRPLLSERMELIGPPAHYDNVDF